MNRTIPLQDPDFGPDLLSDPSFVPCRDEACSREGIHGVHEVAVRARSSRSLSHCPRCQTPVVVTQNRRQTIDRKKTRHVITATCPGCGWTFQNSLRKAPQ